MIIRILALCCCIGGFLTASYLGWALHRSSGSVMMADGRLWPRSWPYPDGWLLRWHDRIDAADPAPQGGIKIHGEWPRLHYYLSGWFAASSVVTLGAGWLLVLRRRRR